MFKANWSPKNPLPVIITEIKDTRNTEIKNVRLEQAYNPRHDVSGPAALLGVQLQGGSQIASRPPKVFYTTFSAASLEHYGLVVGSPLPEEEFPNAFLARHEFIEGERIPEELRGFNDYRNLRVFAPRTWENTDGTKGIQKPKTAGKEGEVLKSDGHPIFINTVLTTDATCQANKFIQHDNVITRGNNATAIRERMGVAAANMQTIGNTDLGMDRGSFGSENEQIVLENYKPQTVPSFESEQTQDHTTTSTNRTTPEGRENIKPLMEAQMEKVGEAGGPKLEAATSQADVGGANPESIATGSNVAVDGGKGTVNDPLANSDAQTHKPGDKKGK